MSVSPGGRPADLPRSGSRFNPHPGRLKRWWFGWYGWIAAALVIVLFASLAVGEWMGMQPTWQFVAGWTAGIWVFVSAIHRQRVAEFELFTELFTDFNRRYDRLNKRMNEIRSGSGPVIEDRDVETLYRYFNLCGEEYLYWQEGAIHPEAWRAWREGMRYFMACPRIAEIWKKELAEVSYYGLTANVITDGDD